MNTDTDAVEPARLAPTVEGVRARLLNLDGRALDGVVFFSRVSRSAVYRLRNLPEGQDVLTSTLRKIAHGLDEYDRHIQEA